MLIESFKRRYDEASTAFALSIPTEGGRQSLGGGEHVDAIIDRSKDNAVWVETGTADTRKQLVNRMD